MKRKALSEFELQVRHHRWLKKKYGMVVICDYEYNAADVLQKLDPMAYQCSYLDWLETELDMTIEQVEGVYYDIVRSP